MKGPGRRLKATIRFRATLEERRALEQASIADDRTMSEFARQALVAHLRRVGFLQHQELKK